MRFPPRRATQAHRPLRVRSIIIPSLLLWLLSACSGDDPGARFLAETDLREGDVLFQEVMGGGGDLVRGTTGSHYTHCGLAVRKADGGFGVLEAVGPVTVTPLTDFLRRGRGGWVAVYRLRPEWRERAPEWVAACRAYLGRPYDSRFRWDDESIYCSELLWKGWYGATGKELAPRVRVEELDWKPWRKKIERLEGGPVPLERELVTPRDLARSPFLELVRTSFPPGLPLEEKRWRAGVQVGLEF